MRFSQLGAVAGLAGVSQGFLIPPTVKATDNDIVNILPFDVATDVEGRVVDVLCPGCPVLMTDVRGHSKYSAPVESLFRFNFSLEHADVDHLLVNGHHIYPVKTVIEDMLKPLEVDQLIKAPQGGWNHVATAETSYLVAVGEPLSTSDERELQLIHVRLEILEMAGIHGFPFLEVKLLKTPSGKLMIGDAYTSKSVGHAKGPLRTSPTEECTSIICQWRAIIADKISKLKGCGGRRPAHTGAMSGPTGPFIKPGHGAHSSKPHHARPHGAHGHHGHHRHRHGRFSRVIRTIVFHVLVPILIGIVVGITASLVGMIVGHILIFIWRVLFRRGQRAQSCRFQEVPVEKSDDDESRGFLEQESAPPVYEDAPAYEEAVEKA